VSSPRPVSALPPACSISIAMGLASYIRRSLPPASLLMMRGSSLLLRGDDRDTLARSERSDENLV
jgi:hypothetical protein